MKSNWKEVSVADLGHIITGKTPKTAVAENYGGDIPFLTPSDDMSVKLVEATNKTITPKGLSEVKNCLLPPRSICVSCIGSDLGKVVMTTQETVTNQQINSIIPKDGVDADFVYYAMLILGKELNYISKTSTAVPIINKSSFSNYTLSLPPIDEQRKIADTLSALDARIAENKKINHHLEQMAQAIFKSWFVDFEPWGGIMPKNWSNVLLNDIADVKHGFAFKGEFFCDEKTEFLLVTPGNFAIGGGFQEKPKYYNGSVPKEYILNKDDVIVAMTDLSKQGDTLGYSALVPESNKYLHNQRIGLVSIKGHPHLKECVYWLMRTYDYQRFVVGHASGSTVKHTSPKTILSYPAIVPDDESLQVISSTLHSISQKISQNSIESSQLAVLRNNLLPRLMSGEISVADLTAK